MVGKGAQMTEHDKSAPPMYNLHRKVFPVLLRLACDVDQVFYLMCSSGETKRRIPFHCRWKCKPNHVLPNVSQLLGDGRVCAVLELVGLRSTGS